MLRQPLFAEELFADRLGAIPWRWRYATLPHRAPPSTSGCVSLPYRGLQHARDPDRRRNEAASRDRLVIYAASLYVNALFAASCERVPGVTLPLSRTFGALLRGAIMRGRLCREHRVDHRLGLVDDACQVRLSAETLRVDLVDIFGS